MNLSKKKLTEKQKFVLASIKELTRKLGKSPTLEEIRINLGYTRISSVQRHIEVLKKKGYLTNKKHKARSIQIDVAAEKTINVPLVGNVSCGTPFLAQENIEAYIPYEKSKLRGNPSDYFFLKAVGDSMNKAGIEEGDFVLVKQSPTANPGTKVVALIGEEATIKILKKEDNYYVLAPESTNPENKKIILLEDFSIQGVVKDVVKIGGEDSD